MGLDHVANDVDIDPELLVDEYVPEAADLRPGDLGVRIGDLRRQVVRRLSDDLKVPLDGVLRHVDAGLHERRVERGIEGLGGTGEAIGAGQPH